jgi:hypothetical protein
MSSVRKIAANRRNAKKSTGPRSTFGRQRANRKAYRHGLAARSILSATSAKQVERLARKIAGIRPGALTRELARSAAEAMLDLARVRQAKIALLERVAHEPSHGSRELLFPDPKAQPALNTAAAQQETVSGNQASSPTAAISAQDLKQESRAVLQNLPELRVLERSERRISSRRDSAIRHIAKRGRTDKVI